MFIIEFLSVIFTLICVYLTVKKSIWAWPISLIGVALYSIVFYRTQLFADFGLQIIFFIQGVYGWINWYVNKDKITKKLKTTYLSLKGRLLYTGLIMISYVFVALILDNFTNSNVPYIDSFVAVLSLYANWLLARRRIDNWVLWIIADLVYVGLFYYKGLYMSMGLYFIFLFMAGSGLINWIKTYKKETLKI